MIEFKDAAMRTIIRTPPDRHAPRFQKDSSWAATEISPCVARRPATEGHPSPGGAADTRDQHRPRRPRETTMVMLARIALLGACLLPSFLAIGCGETKPENTFPEAPIIIIDIDTLRASHLGCYGYHRNTSPNIDTFAASAQKFNWAFAQAPNTPPSQASILTGLYPTTHGMIRDEDTIPEAVTTLAETLRDHGWETAAFVDGGYMAQKFGMDQGFNLYNDSEGRGLATIGPKASQWVSENGDSPFLLLIHTYDTHTPYAPKEPYRSLFIDEIDPPSPGFEPSAQAMETIRTSVWTDEPLSLPPNDLEYAKAMYDSEIRYVDTWVGSFLEHLADLGLDERSIIVVISDHGEEFQEHGSVLHEKLYTTVTHIPLIIGTPKGFPARAIESVVESVDLMPTLLDLVGVPVPSGVQGESLVPLMLGAEVEGIAFGESPDFGVQRFAARAPFRFQLTGKRYITELYDFKQDPTEQHDLSEEFPLTVDQLYDEIKQWEKMTQEAAKRYEREQVPLDESTRDQLEALGYLN
jgi:arylsulfatase A-like enzyme